MCVVNIPPDRYRLRDAISSANSTETLALGTAAGGGKSAYRPPISAEEAGSVNPLLLNAHYNGAMSSPTVSQSGSPIRQAQVERTPLNAAGTGSKAHGGTDYKSIDNSSF